MNSWDEDPHERLRQRLQAVFADHKVPASSSLRHRVLDPLRAARRRRRAYWMVGVGLLLLMGGVFDKSQPTKRLARGGGKITSVPMTTALQPLPRHAGRQPTTLTGQSIGPGVAEASPVVGRGPARQKTHATSEVVVLAKPRTPFRSFTARQGLPAARFRRKKQATERPADALLMRSARLNRPDFLRPSSGQTQTDGRRKRGRIPLAESMNALHPTLPADAHLPGPSAWAESRPVPYGLLRPLGLSLFLNQLRVLPNQLQALRLADDHAIRGAVAPRVIHWFVEAEPLSSFQWMSAPPSSTVYLSHVKAPAAFSAATWGYQLNGGIRFQHWQAYLSVGQLRRWAYYTVTENRYRLEPSPANPYQLERETNTVVENVSLPMVGAGLSQLQFLSQGRYVLELGGHLSYLPTRGQGLIGLRGGVGRRLLLSQRTELQVGLRVDYGLTRQFSEQQQLTIHPFIMGIGLRIQPRSAHP